MVKQITAVVKGITRFLSESAPPLTSCWKLAGKIGDGDHMTPGHLSIHGSCQAPELWSCDLGVVVMAISLRTGCKSLFFVAIANCIAKMNSSKFRTTCINN